MFLRIGRNWSLAHLCNSNNECVCGWKYELDEFTKIKSSVEKPFFACSSCEDGNVVNSNTRVSKIN